MITVQSQKKLRLDIFSFQVREVEVTLLVAGLWLLA